MSRISALPDEILVSILSLLTINEAVMTSVLSHRWKKLWTFYSGTLIFDVTEGLYWRLDDSWPYEVLDYITCMNLVLPKLVGLSTLDDFTLRFVNYAFDPRYKTHIDRCVEFAMGKRIQRIELDTNPIGLCYPANLVPVYNFSDEFYTWIKQPCGLHNISALISLSLNNVNVSEEFIYHILVHCPLLERLRVVTSNQLLNLKVTGAAASALKLKYLEISDCDNVESVEISSAPNLLSFTYIGNRTRLHVENVPKLVEVSIGRDVITYIMSSSISSYLSQLETLRLDFAVKNKEFTQFLVLKKLRHLILRAKFNKESLLGWTSLIDASPCLQKFTLENISLKVDYKRKAQKVTSRHSHQCLKVVELAGFTGCATEVELAMYFFTNATSLEQIIIDRRDPLVLGTNFVFRQGNLEARKKRGLQLKRYLPPGVDLVVI